MKGFFLFLFLFFSRSGFSFLGGAISLSVSAHDSGGRYGRGLFFFAFCAVRSCGGRCPKGVRRLVCLCVSLYLPSRSFFAFARPPHRPRCAHAIGHLLCRIISF
ncbi:hypothetical protein [Pandoravirus japonicus]|uniref:Uncharacterized protein n=1 Tax=Pandoravirus japonicus TaxID=2823154 RepID=A0A811BMZ5_9VIRU|nr:hypothetical protein [Pandoravirus japonicus]